MGLFRRRGRGFNSQREGGPGRWIELTARPGIADSQTAPAIVARIHETDWTALHHAYGAADDAGVELEALVVGIDSVREEAWWELWGNVHHQNTVYSATVPAVEVFGDLAAWREFPDRRQALLMLYTLLSPDDTTDAASAVRAAARARSITLAEQWEDEPKTVQRALLLLARGAGMDTTRIVNAVLPESFAEAWAHGTTDEAWELVDDEARFDEAMDAIGELESWAFYDD